MEPYTAHRSSYRGSRAPVRSTAPAKVRSPYDVVSFAPNQGYPENGGGGTVSYPGVEDPRGWWDNAMSGGGGYPGGGGAQSQAQALAPSSGVQFWNALSPAVQNPLRSGYGFGGFEGARNEFESSIGPDWYDLPEWKRRGILEGLMTEKG